MQADSEACASLLMQGKCVPARLSEVRAFANVCSLGRHADRHTHCLPYLPVVAYAGVKDGNDEEERKHAHDDLACWAYARVESN
jgi:hypothetical protein